MHTELSIKSRIESFPGGPGEEIPNDENVFDNANKLFLTNKSREFIPKSYFEGNINQVKNLDKSEIEHFQNNEEENLNKKSYSYTYDKLTESNRIDLKMIQKPLFNCDDIQLKKSNMSFVFETENSNKDNNNKSLEIFKNIEYDRNDLNNIKLENFNIPNINNKNSLLIDNNLTDLKNEIYLNAFNSNNKIDNKKTRRYNKNNVIFFFYIFFYI